LSFEGKRQFSRRPNEQANAQSCFQRIEPAPDNGRGNPLDSRRGGQAAAARNADKGRNLFEGIHLFNTFSIRIIANNASYLICKVTINSLHDPINHAETLKWN
jgi:hypothetical protein